MKKIEEVKEIMNNYNNSIKNIEGKYAKPKELTELEFEARRGENALDKLKEELANLDTKNMDTVEMHRTIGYYKGEIAILEAAKKEAIENRDNFLMEYNKSKQEREKQKKQDLLDNETNTRRQLTQSKIKLEEKLKLTREKMKKVLKQKNELYEEIEVPIDEEKTKNEKVVTDIKKFKGLVQIYKTLREEAKDIKGAIKYCEESLEFFREKDNEKVKNINEILNDNNTQTKSEGKIEGKSKTEPKTEPKVEPKTEPKVEPKTEPKVEPKTEPKVEPKTEPKVEPKTEPKVEPKTEPKVEPKVEPKTEPKVEPKTEPKVEPKTEPKVEPKTEPKVEPKVEPKTEPKSEPKVEPKTEPPVNKIKITLDVYANKIKIEGIEDLFYKEEAKRKKELMEKYNIKSFLKFSTIKEQMKSINYALISALERIDDEEQTLVRSYIYVKAGKLYTEEAKIGMEILKKYVDIEYLFKNSIGNMAAKKSARMDTELGISSLYGINQKGMLARAIDKGKDMLNGLLGKTSFEIKENPKTLDKGAEKTEDNKNNDAQDFRNVIDAGDKVKKATENVSMKYKEKDNNEEIHRLREDEYEEIIPE